MKKIGVLSDTHSVLPESVFKYFEDCDEVWHAGDIGDIEVADKLEAFKPFKAVYGNIDDKVVRQRYPLDWQFECEGMKVWMTHIGGYPGKYVKRVRTILAENTPDLFICGHSHILKVMPDKKHHLIHINPGACGKHGFHKYQTIMRFSIDKGKLFDVEAIELGLRAAL